MFLQEQYETKIEYHCTGAQMSNDQPSNVDGMIRAAQNYAQNNRGGKFHAILWPFSALNSYNVAEHQFMAAGRPQRLMFGGHLLKMLNLEYAKLQRLEHTLTGIAGRPSTQTKEALVAVSASSYC